MHGAFYEDPTFWVGIGLLIFVAIAIWKKVPGMLASQLDARAATIARELDEAKRLRQEAEALVASYKARAGQAEKEAEEIIAQARSEAERMQVESRTALEALIVRRTKMAEDKIAQAEQSAVAEVKAAAAGAAVDAARTLLTERIDAGKATAIADVAIRDLRARLN